MSLVSSSDDKDWGEKYDASIADEDARMRAHGYRPWDAITINMIARMAAGFLAALYWALTAEDPLLPAVMAVILGAVILVGILAVLRTRAMSRQ
jgi:hypothetical protein